MAKRLNSSVDSDPSDQIVAAQSIRRRSFLKLAGGGVLGATAMAAGIEGAEANDPPRIWNAARVLIGNSTAPQAPSPFIKCPLFNEDGKFAKGFHTLDLSTLATNGKVAATVTHRNDSIEPDNSSSVAVSVTKGTDSILYLLVAGEGTVTGGTGYFRHVTSAIFRCKYKVALPDPVNAPLNIRLIECVDCVVILVGKTAES
jgi:hypothetical protein